MTPGQVARLFRVDVRTIERWETGGQLKGSRTLGGHRRFTREDVETYMLGRIRKCLMIG